MAEVLVGAAVGAVIAQAYTDLYNVTKSVVSQIVYCKRDCEKLEDELSTHLPIITEISRGSLGREWERPLLDFKKKLEEGKSLVESCLRSLGRWDLTQQFRYGRAILKLRQVILERLQSLPAVNTLQLQQISADLQDMRNDQKKMMDELKKLLVDRQVRSRNSGSTDDARLGKQLDELVQEDRFLVGLNNPIDEVKSRLLSGEEMVLILGGMGGIGKTTLAVAICKDVQVREFYENRIHFFTVSKSPDMKGLLSSIWKQVVEEEAPHEFHNEEDAYRQVKGKLLNMPSKERLLVLDDVWSEANLEHLSFEVKGLKTMITTRLPGTLEKTRHSHTFNLELLSKENAKSLFCYWAFDRQDSLFPSWVKDPLVVEEIISECNRLPLALRVIGKCLCGVGQSPEAWRNARNKLREAKPLIRDNYHEDALLRRLQTSIDALDPTLRECFLDLGAYPEDSQCSANTLLDIWVYVRGMEWVDAVFALVDLSNRCLLDFAKGVTSDTIKDALEIRGNASALVFSQHDVLRDLAINLGSRKDIQRTRLLMPARDVIPKDWQTEAYCSAAQVVSIITTDRREWPPTLAFPSAEALLLHIAIDYETVGYHFPPFIQSMCKLKVMSIIWPGVGSIKIIGHSLRGLSQLQSIQTRGVSVALDFWNLSNLETLHLTSCWSLTHLPTTFGQLLALQKLHLQGCTELRNLPESFGNLSNLETLNLISCKPLIHLPTTFGQLVALQNLYLQDCDQLKDLPRSFGNLSNLKTLDLAFCESLNHLPTTFGQLVALQKLHLQSCTRLKDLPRSFGRLRNLETLDLASCESLIHLPTTFGQLVALQKLHLQSCTKLRDLPESFGKMSNLETLDLASCESLIRLPTTFGQLVALQKLDLQNCNELRDLPDSFGNLSNLETLDLASCESLIHLPTTFGQLVALQKLDLQRCTELRDLPESFGNLSNLETLDLAFCESLIHLPATFGQLVALQKLHLQGRFQDLPESFGDLKNLETLDLTMCIRLMNLPVSFGKLRRLKKLVLRGLENLEALPENFGQLCCLAESFGQLSGLRILEMQEVGLESLPACIGAAGSLVGLESLKCSKSLVPLWKAARGGIPPHPQIIG